ncbi:MAG: hypothetical protein JWO37_973 [Acidimicrobiales bacterium]|nr:hypothetical protein [Acidimicrobiales bacterium]
MSTTRQLWGIGRLAGDAGNGPPYRVSGDDVRKDFKAAIAALQSLGVGAGDHVLFVSMLSEAAQVGPFELAASRLGARYSSADAQQFDAHRTATLVRRVRPKAVLGVNAAVLAGLDEIEVDPAVGARPDAIDRIPGATWWLPVGPAVAVGCTAGRAAGGHVDAGEWRIETDREGQVRISNARPERATALDRWPTGILASIAAGPCGCGRDDPRLVVTTT